MFLLGFVGAKPSNWCFVFFCLDDVELDDIDLFHEGELQQKICVLQSATNLWERFRCFL